MNRKTLTSTFRAAVAFCAVLAVGGCTQEPLPNTPTTPVTTGSTVIFASTLDVGGFSWRQIVTNRIGKVTVRLASLDFDTEAVVSLVLGVFDTVTRTCGEVLETVEAKPDLDNPQITRALIRGDYCVRISDIGNLTRANRFGIVIEVP